MTPPERSLDVEALLAQNGWARRLALRLVGDAGLADDVLQDAWVAALERPPESARLREWFAAVVRNLALRKARREAVRGDVERGAARREPVGGGDAALERLQLQRRLADLVLALDEPCRTAVVLRHIEGLSAREIAARMGCSEEAARQRVARGLARLRTQLDAQSGGDRSVWCGAFAVLWGNAHDVAPAALVGAGASVIGGILVGAKTTLTVVAVGLTLGGVAWLVRGESGAAQPARPGASRAIGPAAASAVEREHELTTAPTATAERDAVTLPAPAAGGDVGLRGRAVDDRGAPLAGVEVVLLGDEGDDVRREATSDAAGAFTFAVDGLAAPDDDAWRLQAKLEGHVPVELERAGPELGELVLVRRPFVSGLLLTPDGTPAAPPGRVELSVSESAGERRWTHVERVEIDGQGRFRTSELAPGRLVEARGLARGFAPGEQRPELELAPGSSHELTLTLASGDVVRGVVLDAASGQPVPFAEVWSESWVYDADSIEPSTVADAGGRFELRGVRATTVNNDSGPTAVVWVSVTARAEGYLGRPFEPTVLRRNEDGSLGQLAIRIGRADASVAGRVTWPDGNAAVGVPVYTVDDGMNLKFAQSDGEGRFTLEGLAPGPLALCARTNPERTEGPHGRAETRIELAAGARATCELVLALPAERISGRVVDEHGIGLAGVEIEAGEHFFTGKLTMGVGHHRALTDAEGRYELADLMPGRYQVEISPARRRDRASRPKHASLDLAVGDRADADFELVPAIVCAGWVDVGEADPADFEVARVRLDDGEGYERQPLGADGRFRFEGCWPEACAIVLHRDGLELARVQVGAAGAEGLVLTAPR